MLPKKSDGLRLQAILVPGRTALTTFSKAFPDAGPPRAPHLPCPRPPRGTAAGRSKRVTGALARKVLSWPKRCELAHAFQWIYSHKKLKLVFLTSAGELPALGRPGAAPSGFDFIGLLADAVRCCVLRQPLTPAAHPSHSHTYNTSVATIEVLRAARLRCGKK